MLEGYKVEGIDVEVDDYGTRRVTGVLTDHGHIKTNCVVNCAGKIYGLCFCMFNPISFGVLRAKFKG